MRFYWEIAQLAPGAAEWAGREAGGLAFGPRSAAKQAEPVEITQRSLAGHGDPVTVG